MKAIVTVIGEDRVGIIAGISTALAENQVNILDISQTVLQEYFTMIMLVDLSGITLPFTGLAEVLKKKGETLGVAVKIQREDIFKSMHHI
jgi:ACT domain-containing protein